MTKRENNFISILNQARMLDIYDMNYVYSSRIFPRFLASSAKMLPRTGIMLHIGGFTRNLFRKINFIDWGKEKLISKSSILFFTDTLNQRSSVKPIADKIDHAVLIGNTGDIPFTLTLFKAYFYSLPFIGKVASEYFHASGQLKTSYKYIFDLYWLTYGLYIAARLWLRKIQPRVLVFGSDHAMEQRVIRKAAREEHIKTVYIQHASVTDEFPVLEFDYALLQGMDTLKTYDKIGESKTKVYLVGNPKLDGYQQTINRKNTVCTLGICTNKLDPKQRVEELIRKIKADFPEMHIILRPHPGDAKLKEWEQMANHYALEFSNSKIEDSFHYLSRIDCNIAGNSNIHLEAVLLNVYPLFFDFALKPKLVQYSFLKEGLCEYYSDIDSVIEKIKELQQRKDDIRHRAKQYNDTIDTAYDFRSSDLAKDLLQAIANQQEIPGFIWTKIAETRLEAYRLTQ